MKFEAGFNTGDSSSARSIGYQENVSPCLRGGGSCRGNLFYSDTVGALQAVDFKGPNRQYVAAGKLVIEIWK